jgi:hypothetical protein
MPQEKYQPSQEEVQRAEDMMGNAEDIMSEDRERRSNFWESVGAEGYLETDKEETFLEHLKGVVNGKEIDITWDARDVIKGEPPYKPNVEKYFSGTVTVGGEKYDLSHKEAWDLFHKFKDGAVDTKRESELTGDAKRELGKKETQAKILAKKAPLEGLI